MVFELLLTVGQSTVDLTFESIFGVLGICHNIMTIVVLFVGQFVREIFHEVFPKLGTSLSHFYEERPRLFCIYFPANIEAHYFSAGNTGASSPNVS